MEGGKITGRSVSLPLYWPVLYTCYFVSAVVVQLGSMGQPPDFFFFHRELFPIFH